MYSIVIRTPVGIRKSKSVKFVEDIKISSFDNAILLAKKWKELHSDYRVFVEVL